MAASERSNPLEREVVITRIFDAPRELVFSAWTEPERMQRWFGPKRFTNAVCELDVRVGGAWRIVMQGPDGTQYPCGGVYREIVPLERLVFTNNALDGEGKPLLEGLTTVTFADHENGRTKLTLTTRATGLAPHTAPMLEGMHAGWSQSLDKLAETFAADRALVTTRIYDAPRDLVFRLWTEPHHIVRWWGPNGFTTTIHEMNVKPGGAWNFIMHGPDGTDYQNRSVYVEVEPPARLVYDHTSGPRFRATVTFEDLRGKTEVTLRMVFETPADYRVAVDKYHAVEGGRQTFQRLEEYLQM